MRVICASPMYQLIRVISVVTLALFLAKLWLWANWPALQEWWNGLFLTAFTPQLTEIVPDDPNAAAEDRTLSSAINWFNTARTTLSCYVIACALAIVVTTAFEINWPPVDFVVAPGVERPANPQHTQ